MQDNSIIWKPVVGFEGSYEVSSTGEIRSIDRDIEQMSSLGRLYKQRYKGKMLEQRLDRCGYLVVQLGGKSRKVHRIVAQAFHEKIDAYNQVNHKNGTKTDNSASNLEWCNCSENHIHKFRVLGYKSPAFGKTGRKNPNSKPCVAISLKDGTFHNFECTVEAVKRGFGLNTQGVGQACLGRYKQHNGYIWSYA
jgi:hypothetical protein